MIIHEVIRVLEQEYGLLVNEAENSHLDVLIRTILSQNTSDVNSLKAFHSLKNEFSSWYDVASAPVEQIAYSIKNGGLSRVKASRIKFILQRMLAEQGSLSLSHLNSMANTAATEYLLSLPGVGPKTANCVLLFSMGRASFPVDTHIFRVSKRLGLIDEKVSIEEAHQVLQSMVPPDKMYQLHLHLIWHGRRICLARKPRCSACSLRAMCPSSQT